MNFFLLQDLVKDDGSTVNVWPPFDEFKTPAVPQDIETYNEYRCLATAFIEARNERIEQYAGRRPAL